MLIEGLFVLPFFDVGDPARIVGALVEFVADAAGFFVSRLHQRVHGGDEFVGLAFFGAKFRHADDLGFFDFGHR